MQFYNIKFSKIAKFTIISVNKTGIMQEFKNFSAFFEKRY